MSKHRLTTTSALLALGMLGALAPAASASSTLLSGYGGPGQGNQAILGSTLIGGSGGGTGSSGGNAGAAGGGEASSPQSVSIEAAPAHVTRARAGGHGSGTTTHQGTTPAGGAVPGGVERALPAPTATSASAAALGLSGSDAVYVVLVLVVLALTALVTVLLTRGGGATRGGPGATESS